MANGSLTVFLRRLRRLAARQGLDPLTDRQLLQRFTAAGDEAAFAALVARHGGLVHGVAGRVLRDPHAAEDVFQATFLVLARKAASIRRHGALAGWLYRVSYRLALDARAEAARRCLPEQGKPLASSPDPSAEMTLREQGAVLDEELQGLPERYRAPLVLFYLEDRTQEEAARLLGWAKITFRRRLERGRELLRGRLERRGVALSTGLLVTALGTPSRAASALLVERTIDAALAFAAGDGLRGAVAAKAAVLAEGALQAMLMTKLKLMAVFVVTVSLLGTGAGLVTHHALADKPAPAGQPALHQPPAPVAHRSRPAEAKVPRTDRFGDPLPDGALARLGTTRWRHGLIVHALAFAPDGRHLVTAGAGRGLCLWEAATGREVRVFLPGGEPWSLAFSPDGKTLAAPVASDSSVRLWEVATGHELRRFTGHLQAVMSVAVSPDGRTLASGSHDQSVRLWDLGTGQELHQMDGHAGSVFSLAFSPDGALLASGSHDQTIRVWDRVTGKERGLLRGHTGSIAAVCFSADGKALASGSDDGTLRLWDVATRREVRRLGDQLRSVKALAFSPDGRLLASGNGDRTIRLWDVATAKELRRWEAGTYTIKAVAFSPDGKVLASGSPWESVRRWEVATGQEIHPLGGHVGLVDALRFAQDGRTLYSLGRDKKVLHWGLSTGDGQVLFGGPSNGFLDSTALAPGGRTLATAGRVDHTVRLWDLGTSQELRTLGKPGARAYGLTFSPNGKLLAFGSDDKTARLWDAATGKERHRFEGEVYGLAFSPDSRLLATAGRDQTLRLWDTITGKELRSWPNPFSEGKLAFSPDGRWLVSTYAYAGEVSRVWEVATGKLVHRLGGHDGGAYAAAFSPDSRFLATGGVEYHDNAVRIWEMASGQEVRQYRGHHSGVVSLAYAPDGRTVASGGGDANVMLWDVTGRWAGGRTGKDRLPLPELEAHWAALGGEDAAKACQSIWDLAAAPSQAVPFLRQRLRPVPVAVDPKRLERLLAELDGVEFATRQQAGSQLEGLGEAAEPALRRALAGQPTLELRRRLEQLLQKLEKRTRLEVLRELRAVTVLETVASPEARQMLTRLAQEGWRDALREEAATAVARLAQRSRNSP